MYYVYVFRSLTNGKLYAGFTKNIDKREKQHLTGKVYTTARFGKITLIFYEAFINEKDAREREQYFKTTKGKRTLKLMLKHTFAAFVYRSGR